MILDTNAISALFQGDTGLTALLGHEPRLTLPAIVVGEYRYGLQRSRQREPLERLLDDLVRLSRILMIDLETAYAYAEIRDTLRTQGTPIPENDVWIAALCRQHGLPLASRDRHFDAVPGLERREW